MPSWQNKREREIAYRVVFVGFQTCANICEHDVVPRGGIPESKQNTHFVESGTANYSME